MTPAEAAAAAVAATRTPEPNSDDAHAPRPALSSALLETEEEDFEAFLESVKLSSLAPSTTTTPSKPAATQEESLSDAVRVAVDGDGTLPIPNELKAAMRSIKDTPKLVLDDS